jgi:hypothetical protein
MSVKANMKANMKASMKTRGVKKSKTPTFDISNDIVDDADSGDDADNTVDNTVDNTDGNDGDGDDGDGDDGVEAEVDADDDTEADAEVDADDDAEAEADDAEVDDADAEADDAEADDADEDADATYINADDDGYAVKQKFDIMDMMQADVASREVIVVGNDQRVTSHVLSKTEITEALSIRCAQIQKNPIVFVDITGIDDPIIMAKKEINERKCPLILRRLLGRFKGKDYYEYWDINEMTRPYVYDLTV